MREAKRDFLQRHGRTVLAQRTMAALHTLKERVLPNSAAEDQVRFVVFPNLGYELLDQNYFPVFDRAEAKSLWAFGSTVGHLGAGDGFAGLAWLLETGALRPGDRVLLVGAGAGFTWTLMLLEMNPR
jgi:3-oxoacyl-[acyl-carrier-protein] synthase-3